jgi:hypothetical protein
MSGIPGLIPKEQIAQIAAGIREFGFTNPILIDDKQGVIAWYGRLAVARKKPVLEQVPRIDLNRLNNELKEAEIKPIWQKMPQVLTGQEEKRHFGLIQFNLKKPSPNILWGTDGTATG